jgi:lipoprotein-anchoring transpeptidase ErfK/SrfK
MLVSPTVQSFAAYDSGRLVHWGPVSTGGARAPTATGLYHVNWKLPEHRSTVDLTWFMRWCVNIDNQQGTAIHQYALPGRPESHCCIRLAEDDPLGVRMGGDVAASGQ